MGAGKSGENWPVNPVTEAVAEALTWVAKVGGRIQVRWNDEAAVTPFGQMAFFIEFLNLTGLLQDRIDDRPLAYLSPNAPTERDLLGTWLLSILAGHRRYAHVTAIRGDGVNPDLLGMAKVVREDALTTLAIPNRSEFGSGKAGPDPLGEIRRLVGGLGCGVDLRALLEFRERQALVEPPLLVGVFGGVSGHEHFP